MGHWGWPALYPTCGVPVLLHGCNGGEQRQVDIMSYIWRQKTVIWEQFGPEYIAEKVAVSFYSLLLSQWFIDNCCSVFRVKQIILSVQLL